MIDRKTHEVAGIPKRKRDFQLEKIPTESLTEQTGYLPPKLRIEQMMAAGQSLSTYKKGMYDWDGNELSQDEMSPIVPVTRIRGVDRVDVDQQLNEIAHRQKEKAKRIAEAEKAEKMATEQKEGEKKVSEEEKKEKK